MKLIGCLAATITLFASTAYAEEFSCTFVSESSGSVIAFAGDETQSGFGHVTVDGKNCTYQAETSITCGTETVPFIAGNETIDYKGEHFVSLDHCSAGPE